MIHRDTLNIDRQDFYKYGWLGKHAPSAGELAGYMTQGCWSPCLWSGGVRLKKNFKLATWIGLDFDENVSLKDALEKFQGYVHVIGTTKNHGIAKGDNPACDRFRVVLRFLKTCHSLYDYEETCRKFVKEHRADRACIDGARKFNPCKEIVSVNFSGRGVYPVDSAVIIQRRNEALDRKFKLEDARYGKSIPLSVANKLKFGVTGNRNIACFQVGKDLARRGFRENEIVDILLGSSIHLRTEKNIEDEVRSAVKSALRSTT
jgi:hypothetical protein